MNIITIAFQLFLSLALLIAASIVTFRPRMFKRLMQIFPQSLGKRIVQAIALWIALIATLGGIAVPFFVFFASCITLISSIPLVLKAAHLKVSTTWVLPIVLVVSSVVVGIAQPLGLKVIALPKADELPLNLCAARVIKTYDEGLWFEGIAASEDGALYLSGNRNLDFSRNDYYHDAQGELIERKLNGSERIIFKTPKGFTSGVPLFSRNKSIYLTSNGATPCIWKIDSAEAAVKLVEFPKDAWPNGLDEGPDSMLYSPDSKLGVIWRIDPKTGTAEVVLRDTALLARPFISLAPGANGLHFKGRDMLVTVSDRTTLLSYTMNQNGKFGKSVLIAKGIPGDDFAIGQDGSLFITTHPYNTVVKVTPSGERSIIAKMEQHIVGPTDAVFGKTPQDQNTLYVVTDGGAFTGGPKTKGELVALEPYMKK